MPRVCTICNHPKRAEIERAVAARIGSIRSIADTFDISRPALIRHLKDHLSEKVARAAAEKTVQEAENLIETIHDMRKRSRDIYTLSMSAKKTRDALMAIREERETVKLLAQIQGEVSDQPSIAFVRDMTDDEIEQRARAILERRGS